MNQELRKYLRNLIIFTAIIGVALFTVFTFALSQYFLLIYWVLLLFFPSVAFAIQYYLTHSGKIKNSQFYFVFMLSNTIKFFVYLTFIIVYVLIDKSNAIPFVSVFVILYVLYTIFEVKSLSNYYKNK